MPAPTITKVGLMSSLCVGYVRRSYHSPTGCTCEVSSPATATCTAKPGGSATTDELVGVARSRAGPGCHVLGHVKTGQPPDAADAPRGARGRRRSAARAEGRRRSRPAPRDRRRGRPIASHSRDAEQQRRMVHGHDGRASRGSSARRASSQARRSAPRRALDAARIGGVDGDEAQRPAARGVAVVLAGHVVVEQREGSRAALSRSSWLPPSTWTGIAQRREQLADALVLARDARARSGRR